MRRAGQHSLCWPSGARGGRAPFLLKLHRSWITQGRMQPATVVHLVDEVRQPRHDLVEGLIVAQIDLLALECLHEALRLAVVIGVAAAPHRAHQPMRGKFAAIDLSGVLSTTVGMMNQARWW